MEWPAGTVAQVAAAPNTDPRLSWTMSAAETAAVIRRIEVPWVPDVLNMGGLGCSTPYWKDGQIRVHGCRGEGSAE